MRRMILLGCVAALAASCGYGKDTGPKAPKPQKQFEPLADQFAQKSGTCFEDVFKVNMGRPMTAAERADKARRAKALQDLRKELLGCLTGKGYGNEIQLERQVVEVWMGKTGCPQFAAAAYKAPQCIAIQSVLEETGYDPDAAPPARPPAKKRPHAAPPTGK